MSQAPMNELNFNSIRAANQAREAHDYRTDLRKKNLLLLVWDYLHEEGYLDSAKSLERETNLELSKFEVCDNIDLETVLQEYEAYYYVKFSRYPKISKKVSHPEKDKRANRTRNNATPGRSKLLQNRPNGTSECLHSAPARSNSSPSLPDLSPADSSSKATQQMHIESMIAQVSLGDDKDRKSANKKRKPSHSTPTANGPQTVNAVLYYRKNGPTGLASSSAVNPSPPAAANPLNSSWNLKTLQPNQQPPLFAQTSPSAADPTDLAIQGTNKVDVNSFNEKQARPRPGQIIDYRAMLNDATKLGYADLGSSPDERVMKPLGLYGGYSQEWRDLAQVVLRDVYLHNPNVNWDDIIGLDGAKGLVKESVVYPIKYPQLFSGILSPWKGLLLYGPPGTGKTLMAKAVATECKTTFFNISASTIVSKWRGDSEKLVRILFELARFYAPSTIFLDEIDALMSHRSGGGGGGGEHEGSRRMKTELFVQMDGLAKTDDLVFLLAASNIPWELDHAMLRRLEKRILVGLPTFDARKKMFQTLLPANVLPETSPLKLDACLDYDLLAERTDGYSGNDIRVVAKEAAMQAVRKIFDALEHHTEGDQLDVKLDRLVSNDVLDVLQRTKPAARSFDKFEKFRREYESA